MNDLNFGLEKLQDYYIEKLSTGGVGEYRVEIISL